MGVIDMIRQRAKLRPMTICLPEYEDSRVQEAHKIIASEGLAKVLLLTPDLVDPAQKERYIEQFYEMRKAKGTELADVRKLFEGTLYYGAMLAREGKVDGFVAGASHTTPDMARAAIHCLGLDERFTIACSCFIMSVPDCEYGDRGAFVFADCGIIPDPTSRQLACIAVESAELAAKVLGLQPRVAFLSYSTKGSAKGRSIEKVEEALAMTKDMAPNLLVDGELQLDSAIVPRVAEIKYPNSPIGGRANVLVFPDLNAGNIGYKLVERLGRARALGPLILGLSKPCSDLSRGCSAEDIVDCVAVTAIRAQ